MHFCRFSTYFLLLALFSQTSNNERSTNCFVNNSTFFADGTCRLGTDIAQQFTLVWEVEYIIGDTLIESSILTTRNPDTGAIACGEQQAQIGLDVFPVGTSSTCFYGQDGLPEDSVQWEGPESPTTSLILMIIFWVCCCCCFCLPLIFALVGICYFIIWIHYSPTTTEMMQYDNYNYDLRRNSTSSNSTSKEDVSKYQRGWWDEVFVLTKKLNSAQDPFSCVSLDSCIRIMSYVVNFR